MGDMKPCLVVSTGRSGSMMISRLLSIHPATLSFHEPKPYLSTENFRSWKGNISEEKLKHAIHLKRDRLLETAQNNGLMYIESSHFLVHLILPLYDIYQPRIVYIYRDGRDFVRSGLIRSWYQGKAPRYHLARILRRLTLLPIGDPIEDHQLIPPRHARTRFEKAAWLWNEVNDSVQKQLQGIPQADVLWLKLEEINIEQIQILIDFLGIQKKTKLIEEMMKVVEMRVNRTKRPYSIAAKEEWTEQQETTFLRFARDQMRRLGYL